LDLIKQQYYNEELVKCSLSHDYQYIIVNSMLVAKPLNKKENNDQDQNLANRRNSRLFVFKINYDYESTSSDCTNLNLVLLSSIELNTASFSKFSDSFF
jgi:hypothetical protein